MKENLGVEIVVNFIDVDAITFISLTSLQNFARLLRAKTHYEYFTEKYSQVFKTKTHYENFSRFQNDFQPIMMPSRYHMYVM